jgi:branched-chain amino acid aminotransferase
VWLDGRFVPPREAVVSVFDHGLTVGDGVFETLKTVAGVPFAMRRHLERLRRSASGLGLTVPYEDDVLRHAMTAVAEASGERVARVRLTVTGGSAPLGSDRADAPPTLFVAAGQLLPPDPSAAVVIVPWTRSEHSALVGLKTTSYAENVVALAHAKANGASEALFANTEHNLCEGTGSNVFAALGRRLVTPPLSSGCLAGVTRALVIELTGADEEDLPMEALARADELFLTSTGRDVQPVHLVDGRPIAVDGPCTADARSAFAALLVRDSDP